MSFFGTISGIFTQKQGGVKPPQFKQQLPKQKPVFQQQHQKQKVAAPQQHPQPQPQKQQVFDDTQIREAQARAREIIVEAKDEALAIREKSEREARQTRQEIIDKERSVDQKVASLDARLKLLDDRDKELLQKNANVDKHQLDIEELKKQLLKKLEHVAGLTRDQAKQQVLESIENQLSKDMAQMIQASESKAKEEADEKAREILVDAMKHGATDYVAEYTVSVVKIPDEDVKGRIIGKDGRNIRAFELATGVDVDLDDQPGQVRISSFDPVRREIARITLERLIKDGRIQPTRIEETIKKVTSEIQKITYEEGKHLCHAVGVYNLPADLMQILGRFKYRFSYGQNLIAHTLEETKIGIALAHEVGANVEVVKLGCLLHDIGKVVTEEEGSHVEVGVNLLRKFRIPQVVIDCVEQHHEDVPFTSNEAVLVYIADAISGARPGARYENYEEYVKRLTTLEDIAKSYEEVREAYAIQAGREVRVILNPEHSKDEDTTILAHKVKERVQKELTYPGTVTITVIREVRGTDIAK
ncbi:MAG TPA: ribonuclease Y [Patescibacteria group bacterium]|nr:ribonuclease Y [Patescibacteria group bacterium]